jgi:hypothetical protein
MPEVANLPQPIYVHRLEMPLTHRLKGSHLAVWLTI